MFACRADGKEVFAVKGSERWCSGAPLTNSEKWCTVQFKTYQVRRRSQQRRLPASVVTKMNSVLTNSFLLVYVLHFVSAVTP